MLFRTWSGTYIDVVWNPDEDQYYPRILWRWALGWLRFALRGFPR